MSVAEKTIVITGANAGIGFQMALTFCKEGAHVIMACRSMDKAQQAKGEILEEVPNAKVDIIPLDVSELSSINEFVRRFSEQFGQLDILINNAGIVTPHFNKNSLGYELHLATNYLGAFALTGLMLPYFTKSTKTRIVNVCSLAHRFGKFDFDDPNYERRKFNHWRAYAQSKIATAAFTNELNRRLQLSGSDVVAVGAHPGFAATDMGRKTGAVTPRTKFGQWYQDKMEAWIVGPANQAALPIILAASTEGLEGGEYFGPTGLFEIKGKPGPAKLNPLAKKVEFGKRIWATSEALTGVSYLPDLESESLSLDSAR